MSLYTHIFGTESERYIKSKKETIDKINSLEKIFANYKDKDFANFTKELQERLKNGETLNDILPDAFAVVREVAKRTLDLRHYDVQILGGITLFESNIVEMRTGEGKTLVATLPAYLNALTGKNLHIITVNDYLARRDAVWMGQVYDLLGMSVGVINSQNESYTYDEGHKELDEARDKEGGYKIFYEFLRPVDRNEAYACNITYGSNNEFAFDYLRDNTAANKEDIVQRELFYALVDEVDSVLIDEARNPFIISTNSGIPLSQYEQARNSIKGFERDVQYEVDEKYKAISLKEKGIEEIEKRLNIKNLYVQGAEDIIHSIENAIKAKALYKRDVDYVVSNGEIIIVDEFTGRLQPGRQWSNGMHQAICAKERVAINSETRTYASITYQNYFKLYDKVSGMTGTAMSSLEEFLSVYNLNVIEIPTNLPITRIDNPDAIFVSKTGKYTSMVQKIKELHKNGQPVLVGTLSIESNEEFSKLLTKAKIPYQVLNAKNHEKESEIIAQAGKKGAVTIATNLAGRGVDIKLGGSLYDKKFFSEVTGLGGLFILGSERNESRRVDNQLRGRSGRQGDIGETQFYVSLEDTLISVFGGSDRLKRLVSNFGFSEDTPIQHKMISSAIEGAQKKIEGHHFDSRKYSFNYDNVLNNHRTKIYTLRRNILFSEADTIKETLSEITRDEMKRDKLLDGFKDNFKVLRRIILLSLDKVWINHLHHMEIIRSSTGIRSYAQKDPMIEYKHEAKRLFETFFDKVEKNIEMEVNAYFEQLKEKPVQEEKK